MRNPVQSERDQIDPWQPAAANQDETPKGTWGLQRGSKWALDRPRGCQRSLARRARESLAAVLSPEAVRAP